MKKKRFYNDAKRNQRWTEPEVGRPIDFAEKYARGDSGGNKFTGLTSSQGSHYAKKERSRKRKKNALIAVCCILIIAIGFIGTDVYMIRRAEPLKNLSEQVNQNEYDLMSELKLTFAGQTFPSISLDGSVMLSAVIEEAHKNGSTAVMFDAKRSDGTIGYASTLSAVESYGVLNSQGEKPLQSVKQLTQNDLLPIARVYAYLDNSIPSKSAEMALMNGDKLYVDENGNTYLNPESEIAYGYIKDIVGELHSLGVDVIVLDGCTIGESNLFSALSQRLISDIGEDLKLLEAVNVSIKGYDAESGEINSSGVKSDIAGFPKLGENQVYVISTKLDSERYASALAQKKINAYIIDG